MRVQSLLILSSLLGASYAQDAATLSPTIVCKDSDDSDTFTLDIGTVVGCDWLTKNPSKTLGRKSMYCHRPVVKFQCPASCQSCREAMACADDTSASVIKLVKANKDVPCAWLTYSNSDSRKATYCPIYGNSCPKSCGYCLANAGGPPTASPTTASPTLAPGTPTASPTTSAPVVPTTSSPTVPQPTPSPTTQNPAVCTDDPSYTFPLINYPEKIVGCIWLTQNVQRATRRRENYCVNEAIGAACADTCGQC